MTIRALPTAALLACVHLLGRGGTTPPEPTPPPAPPPPRCRQPEPVDSDGGERRDGPPKRARADPSRRPRARCESSDAPASRYESSAPRTLCQHRGRPPALPPKLAFADSAPLRGSSSRSTWIRRARRFLVRRDRDPIPSLAADPTVDFALDVAPAVAQATGRHLGSLPPRPLRRDPRAEDHADVLHAITSDDADPAPVPVAAGCRLARSRHPANLPMLGPDRRRRHGADPAEDSLSRRTLQGAVHAEVLGEGRQDRKVSRAIPLEVSTR